MICNNTANPSQKAQDQIESYANRKLCKIKQKIMQSANHAKSKSERDIADLFIVGEILAQRTVSQWFEFNVK